MSPKLRVRLSGFALLTGLMTLGDAQSAKAQPPCPPVMPPNCLPDRPLYYSPARPDGSLTPGADSLSRPNTATPSPTGTGGGAAPSFGDLAGGAGVGSTVALSPGGYIDNAMPRNMLRTRFDYGFDMNRPDRAEFFYAAWREVAFHPHGVLNQRGTFQSKQSRGPDPLPGSVDYQEVSSYLEYAPTERMSISLDVPFRMLQLSKLFSENDNFGEFPEPTNDPHEALERAGTNFGGLGDIILGFKYALIADQDQFLTFQFRTFFPSGYARHGLGTGHYSIEPGVLYSNRLSERLSVFGQIKAWVPINATTSQDGRDFSGTILIYGLGVGYDVVNRCNLRVTPVAEVVGWTVTNGFESVFGPNLNVNADVTIPQDHAVADIGGTTIVNGKLGVRTFFGDRDDVYIGVGKSLTGDRWYDEIIRIEYRHTW